jgi:signal transduction histidine kinase
MYGGMSPRRGSLIRRTRFALLSRPAAPSDPRRTERVLAIARIFFAGSALAAVIVDPSQPARYSAATYLCLALYLVAAIAISLALRYGATPTTRFQNVVHCSDLLWATVVTALTEGPNSPFFLFFMFVLMAAAARWGFRQTMQTALTAIALLALEAQLMVAGRGRSEQWLLGRFEMNLLIVRSAYLLISSGLLGYLAEEEKARHAERIAIDRIAANIKAESSLWTTFERVAADVVELFGATRLLLLFHETQNGRAFLWSARHAKPNGLQIAVNEVAQSDRAHHEFHSPGDAWRATRVDDDGRDAKWNVLAFDNTGRRTKPGPLALPPTWTAGYDPSTVAGVTVTFSDVGSGVVLLFDPVYAQPGQILFLQRLANQLVPAFYSVYLLRRLRSRVGALERGRIAQELHDGVIQSLIGVDMRLQALKSGVQTEPVVSELGNIQQLLTNEIRDLRDLMHQLEAVDVPPDRLLEHLQELVERFHRETGIAARFVSDVEDVALAPHVCHEVRRITQEALVNIRKHAGARNVLVRFTSHNGAPMLLIDNDGRSFGFTGRLSHTELDRARIGPVIIKQRVRAIGGTLTVESSEEGVRLEITLPPRVVVRHRTA